MSLKTVYPCFPPISRGVPSVLKFDPKRTSLIYANGLTVVIKNVADPTQVQTYTGHQYPVTAVAMAPSGCYMATGDSSGCLRIWACDTPDQILKGEVERIDSAKLAALYLNYEIKLMLSLREESIVGVLCREMISTP